MRPSIPAAGHRALESTAPPRATPGRAVLARDSIRSACSTCSAILRNDRRDPGSKHRCDVLSIRETASGHDTRQQARNVHIVEWMPAVTRWAWRSGHEQLTYRRRIIRPRPVGTLSLPGDAAALREWNDPSRGRS